MTLKRGALLIGLLLPLSMGVLWYSGVLFEAGILSCFPPPHVIVDGYVSAQVVVWQDLDQDGQRDDQEPPIAGVKARIISSEVMTDSDGVAQVVEFKSGCACRCWKSARISIEVPTGYEPTTQISYDLTGQDLPYAFGLASVGAAE